MTLVGVGHSQHNHTQTAISQSLNQALQPLQNNSPQIIIVLASPTTYDQNEILRFLKHHHTQCTIIGCSTSGEITNFGPSDNSIALMAIYSKDIQFSSAYSQQVSLDPRKAGQIFAQNLIANNHNQSPQAAIIFPDGLAGNGADIVRGVHDQLGPTFPLVGGSAADDFLFKQTYQYYDQQIFSNSIVGLGLSGNFTYGIGVRHGWIPIGTSRIVTHAESNKIYTLDDKPAIEIYESQFGKDKVKLYTNEPFAKFAITYPLGIIVPDQDEYLIRDPLQVDTDGSITCAAEVPVGSEIFIMIGGRDEALNAASTAAQQAKDQLGDKPAKAIIVFNCIARKKLLMHKRQEEIHKIQQIFGEQVPLIGFYTYGEQAPLKVHGNSCSFHNQTDVIFALA